MRTLVYYIIAIIFLSCNNSKSKFESKITDGYWLIFWEPNNENHKNDAIVACEDFNNNGVTNSYFLNKDGSVDTLHTYELNTPITKWRYSDVDSLFRIIGKAQEITLKMIKLSSDTIFFSVEKDMMYLKKNSPVWFIRYIPGSIPISVGDSIYRF